MAITVIMVGYVKQTSFQFTAKCAKQFSLLLSQSKFQAVAVMMQKGFAVNRGIRNKLRRA